MFSSGPFAVISLIIGGVVVREVPDSLPVNGTNVSDISEMEIRDAKRVEVAVVVAMLVGIIQSLKAVLSKIPSTNIITLSMGVLSILFLFGIKMINKLFKAKLPFPIPGEIMVVVMCTGASFGLKLFINYNVEVIGKIPTGLAPPAIPRLSLLPNLVADSFAIAIVGLSMGISLAKIFALKHSYSVDNNQELIAMGLCNFISSFFQTFPISCSMSRSLVQESTGGKTQIAGLVASLLVLLVILAIGFVFEQLPQHAQRTSSSSDDEFDKAPAN